MFYNTVGSEWLKMTFSVLLIFTFMHLLDAFIQSEFIHFIHLCVCVFAGNRTQHHCVADQA